MNQKRIVGILRANEDALSDGYGFYSGSETESVLNKIAEEIINGDGKKIETLQQLKVAAQNKRSVFCPGWKRIPAAFVINMTGLKILQMIESGLYIYEKGE